MNLSTFSVGSTDERRCEHRIHSLTFVLHTELPNAHHPPLGLVLVGSWRRKILIYFFASDEFHGYLDRNHRRVLEAHAAASDALLHGSRNHEKNNRQLKAPLPLLPLMMMPGLGVAIPCCVWNPDAR